mgnify:FL=1
MTISRLVSKLRMSGFEVLESNSFSVLYRKNKDEKYKFISYLGGIKHVEDIEPYNLKHINISRYFIARNDTDHCVKALYIEGSSESILTHDVLTYMSYVDDSNETVIGIKMPYDTKILLCESRSELYLVNYLGKKIDLTKYKRHHNGTLSGDYISYDIGRNIYEFGFYYTIEKQGINPGALLEFDTEFRYIRYLQ